MKNIYIVEDDDDLREIVDYLLTKEGYNTNAFENGQKFLDKIKATNPEIIDLIIMDVMLPDSNGIELCQRIKEDEATSHIPIIMMSAHAKEDAVRMAHCANDFIQKPFDIYYFINKVNHQLQLKIFNNKLL